MPRFATADARGPRPVAATAPAHPIDRPDRQPIAVGMAAAGMALVGGSVAVSAVLADAPLATTQAVRYAVACLLLVAAAAATGRPIRRPRGAEWCWLTGVALTGLMLFNVALIRGSEHAEPAVLGVAVACVPLVLAAVGPALEGRRPRPAVLSAAGLVTVGAVLVQGLGRSDGVGLAYAALVLATEAGFTLLAVPVLRTHGAWGVSVHATWIGAVLFAGLAAVTDGPRAVLELGPAELLAVGYLAVGVTAVAFVLWYSAVGHLGAGRAGLLTGVVPVAAAAVGVALGGPVPELTVWIGIAVVAAGLAIGIGVGADPSGRRLP